MIQIIICTKVLINIEFYHSYALEVLIFYTINIPNNLKLKKKEI